MEYVLLFLGVVILGATVFLVVGRGGERMPSQGLAESTTSLPPVLLAERPRAADVRDLRFSVGLRGYRCDQVDEVLDVLAGEIERLHGELDRTQGGGGVGRAPGP